MFTYFLLVITTFWVLKPLKKGLFLGHYDATGMDVAGIHLGAAQAELIAKLLNVVVAYVAVIVFSALSERYRRQQLTTIFSGFFIVCFIGYATVLAHPSGLVVWSFYLFGDLFSTLMVATFFAFLNDSVDADEAKRTYGVVGLGGVLGGALGSTVVAGFVSELDERTWMGVCIVATLCIVAAARAAGARTPPRSEDAAPAETEAKAEPSGAGSAGARLVMHSRYLLAIVGVVGLYEIISTILDFQFSSAIGHHLDGKEAIKAQVGRAFMWMNWTALFVQLFLTSFVMRRFGLAIALSILPLTTLAGSGAFLAVPALAVASLIPALDGGFSYSIHQSAKESLYVPTTWQEKYQAKAFIDMFAQRLAKGLAVCVSLGITLWITDFDGVRWLSLITLPLIAFWWWVARWAGAEFERRTADRE
jgi:AAA family ATP:ADP antiporter